MPHTRAFAPRDLPMPPASGSPVLARMNATAASTGSWAPASETLGGIVSNDAICLFLISRPLLGTQRDHACPPHRLRHADCWRWPGEGGRRGGDGCQAVHARGVRQAVAPGGRARPSAACLRGCRGALREVLGAKAGPSGVLLRRQPRSVTSQASEVQKREIGITPFDRPRDKRSTTTNTTCKPIGTWRSSARRRP